MLAGRAVTNPAGAEAGVTTDALLHELGAGRTDLARLVESVAWDGRSWVVVSTEAVRACEQREPQSWAKVRQWLMARGVTIITI